jgi:hypothetical protein
MAEKKPTTQTSSPKAGIMKLACEVRAKANGMTDEKRDDSFRRGMQLIYGGNQRVAAKTGRS